MLKKLLLFNLSSLFQLKKLCCFQFKGATFFDAAYLVGGWTTAEWLGIMGKFYDADVEKSLGHYREFPINDIFTVNGFLVFF